MFDATDLLILLGWLTAAGLGWFVLVRDLDAEDGPLAGLAEPEREDDRAARPC